MQQYTPIFIFSYETGNYDKVQRHIKVFKLFHVKDKRKLRFLNIICPILFKNYGRSGLDKKKNKIKIPKGHNSLQKKHKIP